MGLGFGAAGIWIFNHESHERHERGMGMGEWGFTAEGPEGTEGGLWFDLGVLSVLLNEAFNGFFGLNFVLIHLTFVATKN